MHKRSTASELFLIAKKFLMSAFVVFSFIIYAIHERMATSATNSDDLSGTDVALANTPEAPVPTPTAVTPSATPFPPTATNTTTSTSSKEVTLVLKTSLPLTSPIATSVPPTAIPPTATPIPPTATRIPPTPTARGLYRDGQYTGNVADAFYGLVQIKITVLQGKVTNVAFLDYPHDRRTSQLINSYAMPYLKAEAIKAQSADVNIVSGATLTSDAFIESLGSALSKARN